MILVQQINHNKNTKERKLTSGTKPLTNYFEKKKFRQRPRSYYEGIRVWAVVKLHLCGDFDNRQSAEAVSFETLEKNSRSSLLTRNDVLLCYIIVEFVSSSTSRYTQGFQTCSNFPPPVTS